MDSLTSRQRVYLKSLAHRLNPILQIGKDGVTETTLSAIMEAFNTRELLKVKVLEASPESARETGVILSERIEGVQLVQVIGRTLVLYRAHPEKPKIELPR